MSHISLPVGCSALASSANQPSAAGGSRRLTLAMGPSRLEWLWAAMLFVAGFLVYQPCWRGTWVWDDDLHLLHNPVLKPGGLAVVWTPGGYLNYWPLTYTVYWIEFHLWGLEPLGFHLVNISLHAISTILIWRILARLNLSGALFAAAIFALHPVNVESVAWIAELKGILSVALALVSTLFYLDHERKGGRWRYIVALAAFLASALAKGEALTLPIVLLSLAWWRRGRIQRRDILRALPYFLIAACMAGIEVWRQHAVLADAVRSDGFPSRVAVAGCAVWFYLGKIIWPFNLMPFYPRWTLPAGGLAYIPSALLVGMLAIAWWHRATWGRATIAAAVCYIALLLPALGFVNIYFMKFSLVADHWQYAATIVPCAVFGWCAARLAGHNHRNMAVLTVLTCLLLLLSVLTWRQSRLFANANAFFETAIASDPESWAAENMYAANLVDHGQIDAAITHYRRSLKLKPDFVDARVNLAMVLLHSGQIDSAIDEFKQALRLDPTRADAHCTLGAAFSRRGETDQAIDQLKQALQIDPNIPLANFNLALALADRGEFDEAISRLQRELVIDPHMDDARRVLAAVNADRERLVRALHSTLDQLNERPNDISLLDWAAWVLAANPNESIRDGAQALKFAEREWKLTGGDDPRGLDTLAAAYANVGRFADAVMAERRAIQRAADGTSATQYRARLELYKAAKPSRGMR